ncbi:biotin--[acetyl-CoA-carboxylase] ligase [Solimonas flava]|uniref:biotin--[acetyl-CoA-carboxylase] ligase n=1 Tax=Solimonas flava TaxID=415849 RepID=UPI00041AD4F1|nr:biotin--[acetyl-CoA-carboxylase] ligase [Solimonas flava]
MAVALNEAELLALVDALADGAWHSGEDLAARSGITRAALAKRIDKLRDWQLALESRQGLGYRLAAPLERLDAAQLQAAAPGLRVAVQPVVDSTSSRLLEADPAQDPQALFAELQTAGRGRRGRQWISPFGANLYVSIAWSWPSWPRALTALSLAVGAECALALRELGLSGVRLKWPNDLLVDGRKLGGILIEHRGEAGGGCRVVIGIGVNLHMDAAQADGVTQPWIDLDSAMARLGRSAPGRNALAGALLRRLQQRLLAYPSTGFAAVAADWADLDASRDAAVRIHNGEQITDGIARGVDGDGALLVDTVAGRVAVHAGEVSLRLA